MKTHPCWNFPENGGGSAAGFNDSSMDTFKGRRLSALVRETIQNSLDAKLADDLPVVVDFHLDELPIGTVPEITSLKSHIEQAKKTAAKQELTAATDFYDVAIEQLTRPKTILFLSVHDSNTTGLTGPLKGPNGAWYALTKGSGLTQKANSSSLGSYGHGSKAPLVSSGVRSVFYLSVIDSKGSDAQRELRFQGKSILQSYELSHGGMSQGIGFFGHKHACAPLTQKDVPDWALALRTKRSETTGTSIFVPCATVERNALPAISIVTIANFFYAIKKGVLEVQVGDLERLTSSNIEEKYFQYKGALKESIEEVNLEDISEAFQTIETIIKPSEHGEQQIQGFGRIDWYLRFGPEIDWRYVAVARGNGMLITKKAPYLQRFQNLKPFDFFVCVTGDGSELLKTLENPAHDNFEFDRIDSLQKRRQAKKKYDLLVKNVRDILKRYAEYSSTDQVTVDELQDLFSDISSDPETGDGSLERGHKMQIANGNFAFRPKAQERQEYAPGSEDPAVIPGQGMRSGTKKVETKGGTLPADKGNLKIVGPSRIADSQPHQQKVEKLRNLRMRPSGNSSDEIVIYFDAHMSGPASLRFVKSGEVGTSPLVVLVDGVHAAGIDVTLDGGGRSSVTVKFLEQRIDFSIEGEAYAIEP